MVTKGGARGFVEQGRAVLADHHGIDHEGKPGRRFTENAGDRPDHGGRAERAGFRGGGRQVFDHGQDLLRDQFRREYFHTRDADGVLHGHEGDGRGPVGAELVERLQVGL